MALPITISAVLPNLMQLVLWWHIRLSLLLRCCECGGRGGQAVVREVSGDRAGGFWRARRGTALDTNCVWRGWAEGPRGFTTCKEIMMPLLRLLLLLLLLPLLQLFPLLPPVNDFWPVRVYIWWRPG